MGKGQKEPIYSPIDANDDIAATKIFEAAFEQGKKEPSNKVHDGAKIVLSALFVPTLFDDSIRDAASSAAFPGGMFTKRDGFKIARYAPHAAAYAYGLDQCKLYMTAEECATGYPIPDNFILAIEYEMAYIHLHVLGTFPLDYMFTLERDRFNWTLGETSGLSIREHVGTEACRRELRSFVEDFVTESAPNYRDHIVAILSMGEASTAAISELEEIAHGVVGKGVAKVYSSIDPALAASYGAALYAWESALNQFY
ncbi:hypothetical protein P154DRAFT_621692 [Amniculicola lignicola CBS 123094]|uniref:Uncharacterized protein n=1 Tax=Amniculicola lignicola CBS 123094 TaxID=1392246 RepID=A0A6A5WA62_9PLEO|nr:hypothetical protein P154DRAFT_621692 [Amniculicola lignicola CBS 123094]